MKHQAERMHRNIVYRKDLFCCKIIQIQHNCQTIQASDIIIPFLQVISPLQRLLEFSETGSQGHYAIVSQCQQPLSMQMYRLGGLDGCDSCKVRHDSMSVMDW